MKDGRMKVKDIFGHADVLVNNAGTLNEGFISKISPDNWWSDFVGHSTGEHR